MATLAELERGLRAADAAGNADDAKAFADAIRAARAASTPAPAPAPEAAPNPAEGMSAMERGLAGAGGAVARLRDRVFPPGSPVDALSMSQTSDNGRARRADLATYEQNKDALGTAGAVGEIAGEVAASAVPLARASSLGGHVLSKALGRMAPASADIAANAAYAGATADTGQRGSAALAGGAGAAGGRLLTRTLGGAARPFVSKDAQTLIDAGIRPTPGQLFGDGVVGRSVRAVEDSATSLPLVGAVINHGRRRSLVEYGNAEINAALKPLGVTIRGSGAEGAEQAARTVSDTYDRVLPKTFITPFDAENALKKAASAVRDIPLLSVEQEGQIIQYVAQKVRPAIESAKSKGQAIDGNLAKKIDAEIGHLARKNVGSANPSDHPLGEALYELQASLRDSLQSMNPDAKKLLTATNTAYRQMLPVLKAADRTVSGEFTPRQLNRASGQYGQTPSALNRAGQNILPSTVPDSGSAGRLLMGGAALGGLSLGGPAAGAAVAAALYSGPGMAFLVDGLRGVVPDMVVNQLKALPPKQAMQAITRLAGENPAVGDAANQLIAQIARATATQQPRPEQP